MSHPDRPLLAVLIDADNISPADADAILQEITDIGDPALRRVYGDWSSSNLSGWKKKIRQLGMQARQQSANTSGKNSSDIGLVIEAMDILHSGRFDGFVLVSSDSDFTQLAGRLREDGLQVIGIGKKKTPASLRNICNRFIFIENIEKAPEDSSDEEEAAPEDSPDEEEAVPREPPTKAVPLIRAAMDKIEQEDEWYNLGAVGSNIYTAHPDFDPRTYGSPTKKLSDLVKLLKGQGFETRRQANHLQLRWTKKKTGK